jgi:hypothetical protein
LVASCLTEEKVTKAAFSSFNEDFQIQGKSQQDSVSFIHCAKKNLGWSIMHAPH